MYRYYIHNFSLGSNINLPCIALDERQVHDSALQHIDVIYEKDCLREFQRVEYIDRIPGGYLRYYDVGEGTLFCLGKSVRICIDRCGQQIKTDYDRDSAVEAALASSYITGMALTVCGLYRGYVPLHAAGVQLNNKFVAILADAGVGKSTLTWTLMRHGAAFASDDVVIIDVGSDQIVAWPSRSLHSRLWKRSIDSYGMDIGSCMQIVPGEDKYWVPIAAEDRSLIPNPLSAMFVLEPYSVDESNEEIVVRRLKGFEAISRLYGNVRWSMISDARVMLDRYRKIVSNVPIYTIRYRKTFASLPALADVIANTVCGAGSSD